MPPKESKRHRADGASGSAKLAQQPDAEEEQLASLIFGGSNNTNSSSSIVKPNSSARKAPEPKKAAWEDGDDSKLILDVSKSARTRKLRVNHSETELTGTEYQARAQARLKAAAGTPSWALAPSETQKRKRRPRAAAAEDEDNSEDDADAEEEEEAIDDSVGDLLRSSAALTAKSAALAPDTLGISRLRDANVSDPARAVIQAVGWHPQGSLLFTASLDARLRFFRIDGKKNPRVSSVLLPDLPITSACWNGDGSEVIATGRRSFFYTYDVAAGTAHRIPRLMGRDEKSLESCVVSPAHPSSSTAYMAFLGANGNVLLANARTKQWSNTLKMEGQVRSAAFSKGATGGSGGAGPLDYPELLTVGTSGTVYVWDLRTMTCRGKHIDEGSSSSTCIAASPDGSRYAVGAASGIVNVYDAATSLQPPASSAAGSGLFTPVCSPKPLYTHESLTTGISSLLWHPRGQGDILLAASQRTQDALKLVHGDTGRTFANWPTNKTPLHYVTAAAFSPQGGFLTVGNDRGRVLLYRVHHYTAV